ncbi:MAG: acyl-CoA dehydratase activase [Planctomycetota bacterium]|jgi:bzd-type benzoyl-CoA reductase Q subunit
MPEQEYWRWTEHRHTEESIDPKAAAILTAGIDVGSVSSQAVILADGKLYAFASMRTGSNSPDSAARALDWALDGTGLTPDDLHFVVGTGYGRVNIPFADKAITEIACHARGANFMYGPSVRTLLDMGGQDCKIIRCDEKGKVKEFLMNDKCAAGTGRGMEVFADLLAVPIEQVGDLSFEVEEEPEPVSSTCVVFAKSEATGLLRKGWAKSKVLAAYCSAMAHKNPGVVRRIEKELNIEALKPKLDTQIAGALGGALFGKALVEKGKGRVRTA